MIWPRLKLSKDDITVKGKRRRDGQKESWEDNSKEWTRMDF